MHLDDASTGGSSGPFFWGGTKFWRRGPYLPPFSSFSTDLGHFILKLLNFDIYFLFHVKFLSLFSRFAEAKQVILGLGGMTMGGGWFPKLVWPKHNMINQQVKVGVANNDKRAKCWCGTGKVGVATATPAIRHSPPMGMTLNAPPPWIRQWTQACTSRNRQVLMSRYRASSDVCWRYQTTSNASRGYVTKCKIRNWIVPRSI